jgi:hypothetical protein
MVQLSCTVLCYCNYAVTHSLALLNHVVLLCSFVLYMSFMSLFSNIMLHLKIKFRPELAQATVSLFCPAVDTVCCISLFQLFVYLSIYSILRIVNRCCKILKLGSELLYKC